MSKDRDLIWAEVEARAQRLLEHAREIEPREIVRRYNSQLRLWHYPAFGTHTTWTILNPGRKCAADSPILVREVSWDNGADRRWFFDPNEALRVPPVDRPTIRLREAALPDPPLTRIMREGADFAVPLIGLPGAVGLDGESWGMENYELSPNIRIQWWCDGPVAWRHFINWVGSLRDFLCRCLDEAG